MTDPLEPRVDRLEKELERLAKTTDRLRRDQTETRRQLRDLAKKVDGVIPSVRADLAAQTKDILGHVDEQLDQQRQFVMTTIVGVARQWPASTIVILTFALTIAASILANWVLAATHLPHIR